MNTLLKQSVKLSQDIKGQEPNKGNAGLFDGDFKQNNKASKPLLILNKRFSRSLTEIKSI